MGDIALARVCKKVYAKVQVVKNEDGVFYDYKVLGITVEDSSLAVTTELCYYVETVRTKQQMWLPYTCMFLAERSRPFYGPNNKNPVTKPAEQTTPPKRKIMVDHVLPQDDDDEPDNEPDYDVSLVDSEPDSDVSFEDSEPDCDVSLEDSEPDSDVSLEDSEPDSDVSLEDSEPDSDVSLEDSEPDCDVSLEDSEPDSDVSLEDSEPDSNVSREEKQKPLIEEKRGNGFKEFVRLGKEYVFDDIYNVFCFEKENNTSISGYLENVVASTEVKFEMVIKNIVTKKEIDNYLHHCWRYDMELTEIDSAEDPKDESENMQSSSQFNCTNSEIPVPVHTPWCLVCGDVDNLWECTKCPASYHLACKREWLVNVIHRKSSSKKVQTEDILIAKILSSTRTITSVQEEENIGLCPQNIGLCPSCMWGPPVCYGDVVWHKLGTCSWWPAKVLTPGATPTCLLAQDHSPHQVALRYYGTLNHSWSDTSKICLFLPKHTAALQANEQMLRQAVLDASDDYIAVYLT
ncbi:uncharacterized protein [Maniola hyperantus]